ncbi:MAG: hypothetical protein QOJ50_1146 [Cryptosporangiaceae bacterium]|jgi:hypothetical protein|nr:hypothetical protein [Cryptosporangiaceae bacterium]
MLNRWQHQGKFGEDYVRVLGSAAGLVIIKEDHDADGVDIGFRLVGYAANVWFPMIEAQVKTWITPRGSERDWHYDGLNEVQFNKLAGHGFTVPRYLFLVQVPADAAEYASLGTTGLLLRHLGYYVSLREEPRIEGALTSRNKAVRVPKSNVLTVDTLRKLTAGTLAG